MGWLSGVSKVRNRRQPKARQTLRKLALGVHAVAALCLNPIQRTFAFGPAPVPDVPDAPPSQVDEANLAQLLGREAWFFNRWRAETDDVRGGASSAQFQGLTDASGHAVFAGNLAAAVDDPFASVSLQAAALPQPLEELKGLILDIAEADNLEYAVGLRMLGAPAGIQHTFPFQPEVGRIEMLFRDFKPTLQGSPCPDSQSPLMLGKVESITLQVRSTLLKDDQPFSLVLRKVEGIPGRELPPPPLPARKTKWICAACGTMNFDTSKFCTRCGEGRYAEEERAERAAKQSARKRPDKWECAACGHKNFAAAVECHMCGAPRG
mmetsp:Transcript_34622/g.79727  ORF Transcript_34622/g.79727 Transcript_34622/m.79727 type:complete len:322 (+) Transcript_34622:26-991(+)